MKQAGGTLTDKEVTDNLMHKKSMDATIRYLYKEHFESISRFIMSNSGTGPDAQDVFQEALVAFIRLVQGNKFRGEASVKTFLFALNKNIWFNELKKRSRAAVRELKYEEATAADEKVIQAVLEKREAHKQLLSILNGLGENCKKLLLLYYYENCPMKEIVSNMHYDNEQVVRNKKYKCLKKLEEQISNNTILSQQLRSLLYD